jgi:hypothetical protein
MPSLRDHQGYPTRSNDLSPIVGLRIPHPLNGYLRAEAARQNMSLSMFLRLLIEAQMRERARRSARKTPKA